MSGEKPSHKVFVVEGEGDNAFWHRAGSCWPHKDGKGLNIMLQAFPLDGKIVCREIADDEHAEEPNEQPGKTGRDNKQQRRTSSSR